MSAREFFDKYLLPNFKEWERQPLDERFAMNATVSANQMADWFFKNLERESKLPNGVKNIKGFRDFLVAQECSDFQIAWDIADAHKHFELDRQTANVKAAHQTSQGALGWGQGGYGEGVYGGGPQIVVDFGNGKKRALSAPILKVVEMWVRLLSQNAW